MITIKVVLISRVWLLPEPSNIKIWSWAPWDSETRINLMDRASDSLALDKSGGLPCMWQSMVDEGAFHQQHQPSRLAISLPACLLHIYRILKCQPAAGSISFHICWPSSTSGTKFPYVIMSPCEGKWTGFRNVRNEVVPVNTTQEGVLGRGRIDPRTLGIGTRLRRVISFTPRPLYLQNYSLSLHYCFLLSYFPHLIHLLLFYLSFYACVFLSSFFLPSQSLFSLLISPIFSSYSFLFLPSSSSFSFSNFFFSTPSSCSSLCAWVVYEKKSVQVRGFLWFFVTSLFLRWGVVSPTPNPQAGGLPLSALRECLFKETTRKSKT
jgi:hypothetical protein